MKGYTGYKIAAAAAFFGPMEIFDGKPEAALVCTMGALLALFILLYAHVSSENDSLREWQRRWMEANEKPSNHA